MYNSIPSMFSYIYNVILRTSICLLTIVNVSFFRSKNILFLSDFIKYGISFFAYFEIVYSRILNPVIVKRNEYVIYVNKRKT